MERREAEGSIGGVSVVANRSKASRISDRVCAEMLYSFASLGRGAGLVVAGRGAVVGRRLGGWDGVNGDGKRGERGVERGTILRAGGKGCEGKCAMASGCWLGGRAE